MEAGKRFGKLVTIEPLNGGKFWSCRCDCGGLTAASRWHLERGLRRSCGCRTRENPDLIICLSCGVEKSRTEYYLRKSGRVSQASCKSCVKERMSAESLVRRRLLKLEGLRHYSPGQQPKCACCGEPRIEFLELDHINGDGGEHRKQMGSWGIYRWLAKHNYPPLALRVLCSNCNRSLGCYGYCPHQEPERSVFA